MPNAGGRRAENSVDGKRYFASAGARRAKFPFGVVDKHQSAEKLPIYVMSPKRTGNDRALKRDTAAIVFAGPDPAINRGTLPH